MADSRTISTRMHSIQAVEVCRTHVVGELAKAMEKHPLWPTDIVHAWAIVQEEAGETQKEVVQYAYETPEAEKRAKLAAIHKEAVQTAAMVIRFLAHIDDYIEKADDNEPNA